LQVAALADAFLHGSLGTELLRATDPALVVVLEARISRALELFEKNQRAQIRMLVRAMNGEKV